MKQSNIAIYMLTLCLLAGCTPANKNSADSGDSAHDSSNIASTEAVADSETDLTPDSDSSSNTDIKSRILPSNEKLSALIEGKETLSFQYYMENVFVADEYLSYIDETIERIPSSEEYTLQELLNKLYEIVHTEDYYYHYDEKHDVSTINYANLDLGADGIPELLLYIPGPFVDSNGGISLIVKELEGKLQVVYAYADWSRSETYINEFGYIYSGGSNGASNHGYDEAVIAADGTYTYGFYEEEESEINGYIHSDDYDPLSDGVICMYTLRVGPYIGDATPTYYTYRVFDYQTYEEEDIPNLYTDSKYKKLMDTVEGKTFITLDEFNALEKAREEEIGITEKIKGGSYPESYPTGLSVSNNSSASTDSVKEPSSFTTLKPDSIQFEINLVEAQSDEYDNLDYAAMPQQSINNAIYECYTLWDNELNSIWNRLMEEVTPEEKEKLLKEQRDWIKAKEGAMEDARIEADGGTLAPQLEYGEGKVQTRKRTYFLASLLAKKLGESFEFPEDYE